MATAIIVESVSVTAPTKAPRRLSQGKTEAPKVANDARVNKAVARKERVVEALGLTERCPTILGMKQPQPVHQYKIENPIGFAQIPIGLAGPLTITGQNQQGTFFAPLATTEATLIASCSRGCKAFQANGGIRTATIRDGMIRAPVFQFENIDDAVVFAAAIPQYEDFFREHAERTTRFGKLQSMRANVVHKEVHVRMSYTCGDASGQNMVTIATHAACMAFLKKHASQYNIASWGLDGTMSGDKKLALMNLDEPRGVSSMAWGSISNDTCKKVLGITSSRLHQGINTARAGAARIGGMGDSVNGSNVIAAMFVACGQDVASVFEAGWAQINSTLDEETKEITLSLYIPSLPVASVGGGTTYATQNEALGLLGCVGKGKKTALAETMVAFALALDVSTASAMSNDTFAGSHHKMARL